MNVGQEIDARLDAVLRRYARSVEYSAPRRWRLCLDQGPAVTCTVADEWILLDQVASVAAGDGQSLIEPNAALPRRLKLALLSDDTVHLRAEMPMDAEGDASEQLETVLADLVRDEADVPADQSGTVVGTEPDHRAEPLPDPLLAEAGERSRLSSLCAEAGWPGVDRPDGRVSVELEVPGRFQQAVVDRADGHTRVAVELGTDVPQQGPANEAVATLLFRVAGLVRLVRVRGHRARLGLEVLLGVTPTAADLAHAFSALSLGCRQCVREVDVLLHDEAIAAAYLQRLHHRTATAADRGAKERREQWQKQRA